MIRWIRGLITDIWETWRDVKELTAPWTPVDVTWINRPPEEEQHVGTSVDMALDPAIAECGKCQWCSRSVWYKVGYSSAGFPVSVLLCEHCAWDLVNSNKYILEFHLTASRKRRQERGG